MRMNHFNNMELSSRVMFHIATLASCCPCDKFMCTCVSVCKASLLSPSMWDVKWLTELTLTSPPLLLLLLPHGQCLIRCAFKATLNSLSTIEPASLVLPVKHFWLISDTFITIFPPHPLFFLYYSFYLFSLLITLSRLANRLECFILVVFIIYRLFDQRELICNVTVECSDIYSDDNNHKITRNPYKTGRLKRYNENARATKDSINIYVCMCVLNSSSAIDQRHIRWLFWGKENPEDK